MLPGCEAVRARGQSGDRDASLHDAGPVVRRPAPVPHRAAVGPHGQATAVSRQDDRGPRPPGDVDTEPEGSPGVLPGDAQPTVRGGELALRPGDVAGMRTHLPG